MSELHGERLARLETQLVDVRDELDRHLHDAGLRDGRLRELEQTVALMIDLQKQARRQEERQYRRLELRLQWLSAAIALAGLVLAFGLAFAHR